ncbi:MAG TPA: methyltransferase domain-containing protein [Phycisphaerae bacterium]|nr:methyltransferase domain-containing protein [Phycisphaerae bacterium]HRY70937.1 methyltransferase domain-containing protein [Phycisphaerae bacterium]HSA27766.1 methyltransferase domain-containing protein [Phycisphaerae bacterium]
MQTSSAGEHPNDSAPVQEPPQFAERFVDRRQAEHYRDRFKKGRRARTNCLENALLRQLGERIGHIQVALDLPSGTGRLSRTLLEFADNVILADSSSAMLEVAREELPDPRVSCRLMDAESISLPDASVDLVFCHRFLYHVTSESRRARMLNEMVRVTRRYVILSYYPPGFLNRWRQFRRRLLHRGTSGGSQLPENQYREEIRAAGLRFVHEVAFRHFPVTGVFFVLERA